MGGIYSATDDPDRSIHPTKRAWHDWIYYYPVCNGSLRTWAFGSLGFLPIRPEVGSLSEGGAAARAGFQVGDVIIDAAGVPMAQWTDWVEFVRARPNQRFDVLVDRAGSQVTLSVMPLFHSLQKC